MSFADVIADVNLWLLKALFVVLTTLSAVCVIAFVYAAIERIVLATRYAGSRATIAIVGLVVSLLAVAGAGFEWHQLVGGALPPMSEQAYDAFPWSKYDWQPKAVLWGTLLAIAMADYFAFLYLRSERQG